MFASGHQPQPQPGQGGGGYGDAAGGGMGGWSGGGQPQAQQQQHPGYGGYGGQGQVREPPPLRPASCGPFCVRAWLACLYCRLLASRPPAAQP